MTDPAVAPDIAVLLQMLENADTPPIDQGTPEQAREGMRVLMVHLRGPEHVVGGVAVSDDTVAGSPARVYRPEGVDVPLPTVAFLHGGGFVIGDLDTHDPLCRLIARDCAAVVVAVDYPMAPEHRFPEPVEAALAAVREVHGKRSGYGGDDRVAVAGDSAGANLCAVAAQEARDLDLTAQLLIYPTVDPLGSYASRDQNATGYFLDLPTMEWFFAHYVGAEPAESALTDVRLSPLHGELAGVAPAVVATAEFDPLRDEGEQYARRLEEAGVAARLSRYHGMIHGFFGMGHVMDQAKTAVQEACANLRLVFTRR